MTAEELLKKFNFRNTLPRRSVLEVFLKHDGLVSLKELYANLQEKTDRTTIYRTLKTFTEAGLVHGLTGSDNETIFKLCIAHQDSHHHLNFVCRLCKEVIDLGEFNEPIDLPKGYQPDEVMIIVKGTCQKCISK